MLISAIRIALFLLLVVAGIWAIHQLIEARGGVTISLAGHEYYFTPIAGAALALAGFVALWLLLRVTGVLLAVLRFIAGDETAISRYFDRSRERRGLEAMARGLAAVAAGDGKVARNSAERAERLLQRPELTRLLNAQAAELVGDDLRADTYYRALAEDPDTAFIGVRGLLNRALERDDDDRALKLAETAATLRPKDASVLDTLYALQSREFDWAGARKTLDAQRRAGFLPKPEANRRDAMLALAQVEDAEELSEPDHARKLALEAAKLDPENAEAVAAAARHLVKAGSKRAAAKQIIDGWRRKPSPVLAAAYAAIEPEESAHERRLRFSKLLAAFPTHPESRMLAAELALMTQDWIGARKAIADLTEDEPTARSCTIRAAIARGEGAPEAEVRGWLARALEARRDDSPEADMRHAALLPLLIGGSEESDVEEAEEVVEGVVDGVADAADATKATPGDSRQPAPSAA